MEEARFSAIFPGHLPIIHVLMRRNAVETLPRLLAAGFAAEAPLTLPEGGAWVQAVRRALTAPAEPEVAPPPPPPAEQDESQPDPEDDLEEEPKPWAGRLALVLCLLLLLGAALLLAHPLSLTTESRVTPPHLAERAVSIDAVALKLPEPPPLLPAPPIRSDGGPKEPLLDLAELTSQLDAEAPRMPAAPIALATLAPPTVLPAVVPRAVIWSGTATGSPPPPSISSPDEAIPTDTEPVPAGPGAAPPLPDGAGLPVATAAPGLPAIADPSPMPGPEAPVITGLPSIPGLPAIPDPAPIPDIPAATQPPAPTAEAPLPTPGPAPPLPAATAVPASVRRPPSDPAQIAALLRRAQALLELGDVSGARRFYARAAEAGSAAAARALGRTYEPALLESLGAHGILPDAAVAAAWYRRADELAAQEAHR